MKLLQKERAKIMRIIAEKENEKLHDKSISELKGYPFLTIILFFKPIFI